VRRRDRFEYEFSLVCLSTHLRIQSHSTVVQPYCTGTQWALFRAFGFMYVHPQVRTSAVTYFSCDVLQHSQARIYSTAAAAAQPGSHLQCYIREPVLHLSTYSCRYKIHQYQPCTYPNCYVQFTATRSLCHVKLPILCPGTYQGTTAVHSSTKAHTVACGAVFTRSWCCHQCLKPNLLQKFELLASSNFCCVKSKRSRAALTLAEDYVGSIKDKFDKYLSNLNLTGQLLA